MPAALPDSSVAQNLANPSVGRMVIFDLLSGPKGSPFDAKKANPAGGGNAYIADPANLSTGALSTGIGFGSPPVISGPAPASIIGAGFNDDYTPGVTRNTQAGMAAATSSILMYIGGGKSNASGAPVPYTAGFGIGAAGNGGSRDAGAGPAFTGFTLKTVTAAAGVANGAVVETGFANRSGVALVTGQSVFGSNTTASAAVA